MAKIYERSLSAIIAQENSGTRSIPEVKLCQARRVLGRVTAGDTLRCRLFFFFYYNTFDLLWLFYIRCFVSSSERKNQIVDTIGTLLHHFLVSSTEECLACFPQCLLRTF